MVAQDNVNYIARNLGVTFHILENYVQDNPTFQWSGRIDFHNSGSEKITKGNWAIHFCFIRMLEPDFLPHDDGVALGSSGIQAYHVNGCMFKLKPNDQFAGISVGDTLQVPFRASEWVVSVTDNMPNWYVVNDTDSISPYDAKTILSTAGESLDFVAPFTKTRQWKRTDFDTYSPYTAEDRRDHYQAARDLGSAPLHVIPQPVESNLQGGGYVDLSGGNWVVVTEAALANEANYLAGMDS